MVNVHERERTKYARIYVCVCMCTYVSISIYIYRGIYVKIYYLSLKNFVNFSMYVVPWNGYI